MYSGFLLLLLFFFLLILGSVMADYVFLEIHPFCPVFEVSWHILFIVISYNPFYFSGISCNFSSFFSDFIYLGLSLFSLVSLVKGLLILFIFSKNQVAP